MIKWIIFDIDGTLIETALSNMRGLQQTMRDLYKREYTDEELHKLMGIPGDEALRKTGIKEEEIMDTWRYWTLKVKDYAHHNYAFEGVEDMLRDLSKEYSLAIVTSKTYEQLHEDFTKRGLLDYFKLWICKEDTIKHKPNPEPLLKALEKAGITAEEAIYLGDALVDYEAAKAAGIEFGHCRFMKIVDHIDCEIIFNNPKEIAELFLNRTRSERNKAT